MFNEPMWKEIGDNVYLSQSGVLALADAKGGCTQGWIKKPERNAASFSYRYRVRAGGKTRRIKCDELVKEVFGLNIQCDESWYKSVCEICEMNRKRKLKPEEMDAKAVYHAERCEEQALVEIVMEKYPHPPGRQIDFWSGF